MTRQRQLGWIFFGAQSLAILGWAEIVHRREPQRVVDGGIHDHGERFGKSELERRAIYQELVRHESEDRLAAESASEKVWNRNHDDYFHERELRRVTSVANSRHLPHWLAWAIFDEGIRRHWEPPPGVAVVVDDAPLAPTASRMATRRQIAVGPKAPVAPLMQSPPSQGPSPVPLNHSVPPLVRMSPTPRQTP